MISPAQIARWLRYLTEALPDMTRDLERLVTLETPSDRKDLLDGFAVELAGHSRKLLRCEPSIVPRGVSGDHLMITLDGTGPRVLLLAHYDTVWAAGTVPERGVEIEQEIARGPGVFDMKAGIVQGLWALKALQQHDAAMPSVEFLCTSDEEIGSPESRELIEERARASDFCLVLEPSASGGALKTARKGLGLFRIDVSGKASHAGLDPENGVSAISELATIIRDLEKNANPRLGTTINVGRMGGGTRVNVVADRAWCEVDVRVASSEETKRVERLFEQMRASREGAHLTVTGGINRGPLIRTAGTAALYERAREVGALLSIDVTEASVGGGSDGNLACAVGTPVLDGLGPVGGGAHADGEWVSLADMPIRAALVAGLLTSLVSSPLETKGQASRN